MQAASRLGSMQLSTAESHGSVIIFVSYQSLSLCPCFLVYTDGTLVDWLNMSFAQVATFKIPMQARWHQRTYKLLQVWTLTHLRTTSGNTKRRARTCEFPGVQEALAPLLLRRMKEDVEKLPEKEEVVVWVELTAQQQLYYRAIYARQVGVMPS